MLRVASMRPSRSHMSSISSVPAASIRPAKQMHGCRPAETGFPFSEQAAKFGDEAPNRGVEVGVNRPAMDIAARNGKPRAGGEARLCSAVATQNDVRGNRVLPETFHRSDLLAHELVQSV